MVITSARQCLSSYLINRQQTGTLKYCASSIKSVHAGVPQGTLFGPLLILIIYKEQLISLTRLCADVSSLIYDAAARLADIAGILMHMSL